MREKSRLRKWLVISAAALLCLIGVAVVLMYWGIRRPEFRQALSQRVDFYLREQLGKAASVRDVQIGWNSIHLTGLSVPLDSAGSRLIVADAEIEIHPSDLLRAPREPLRIIKSVRARGVQLFVSSGSSAPGRPTRSLTQFTIPKSVYSKLHVLDSLNSVQIENAQIFVESADSSFQLAGDLYINANRNDSQLSLAGSGQYLNNSRNVVKFSGTVRPVEHIAEVSALVEVPEGNLPFLDQYLVTSRGGTVSARVTVTDTIGTVVISSSLENISASWSLGKIQVEQVHLTVANDTLWLDPITASSELGTVILSGELGLVSRELNLTGLARIFPIRKSDDDSGSVALFRDTVEVDIRICGAVNQPTITLRTPSISVGAQELHDVSAEAALSSGHLLVNSLSFHHQSGSAILHGEIALDSTLTWNAVAKVALDTSFTNRGWVSRVAFLELEATGNAERVATQVSLFDSQAGHIADGHVNFADQSCTFDLTDEKGKSAQATAVLDAGDAQISAQNAQIFLRALTRDPNQILTSLDTLAFDFHGNTNTGLLTLYSAVHADSIALLPRIMRELSFNGSYSRTEDYALAINGTWSGTNGIDQPFDGSAEMLLQGKLLSIHRLFIDQASSAKGYVDFASNELNLEFDIVDLPFDKLPLQTSFTRRAQLAGRASGHIQVSGSLSNPEWTALLAVVDGAVFGVPGYWINLDAQGQSADIIVNQFELGRDIRRILVAHGSVNISENQIAIAAETGSGNAEDFVTALLGRTGIVSGTLEGSVAVSGKLTRPDVEADLHVRAGKLAKEIYFSDLIVSAQVSVGEDGIPTVRVPKFELYNDTTYTFSGYADAAVRKGGELHVHLEGNGDFLNMLDQMDREFAGYGSDGLLEIDVGGTVDHPQFGGGTLLLRDGRFTFPSATPVPVDAAMEFHVDAQGIVESGLISLRSDARRLTITARSDWAMAYPGLEPLVIPAPRINLGILEIRTGEDGMPVRIPGLMKPEWIGQVTAGYDGIRPITISAETDSTLLISGDAELRNARVTFPFTRGGGKPKPVTRWLLERLYEAQWNLNVLIGPGIHYDVEITGLKKNSDLFSGLRESPIFSTLADYFDHLNVDAVVDPVTTPLAIRETIQDSSFYLSGRLTSSRGKVEYLDQRFSIDYATCEFDETDIMPVLEGRASTIVSALGADTVRSSVPVYLTMYVIDRETQIRQRRGRLDDLTFVLEDDAGNPPENVLALLGYDVGTVGGKAQELVTTSVVRAVGRQWIEPIERRLEKWTPLDEVTLNPAGGRSVSLARQQRQAASDSLRSNGVVRFFTGSQVTVGKYLTNDVFLTYTGELSESESAPQTGRLSLVHLWNLEYRIKPVSPDLVLDFAVEYDEFERRRDQSVSLKYSFALEP